LACPLGLVLLAGSDWKEVARAGFELGVPVNETDDHRLAD
jgi:hypothetical protein